jgi:hypothetical protein
MASSEPHNIFLITELLELILLERLTHFAHVRSKGLPQMVQCDQEFERLTGRPVVQARQIYPTTRDAGHSHPVSRGMYLAIVLRKTSAFTGTTPSRRRSEDTSGRSSTRRTLSPKRGKLVNKCYFSNLLDRVLDLWRKMERLLMARHTPK